MKTNWITIPAAVVALLLASLMPGLAKADKADKADPNAISGRVSAVDGAAGTVTILCSKKDGGELKIFSVVAASKITVNGKNGVLIDIQPKMSASVVLDTDGNTVKSIAAKVPKPPKK